MARTALISTLTDLETAIQNEDYEQIDATLEDYKAAYESAVPAERIQQQRSQALRNGENLTSDDRSKLSAFEQQQMATNAMRSSIFVSGDLFLYSPDTIDTSELATGIAELRSRETALNERLTDATSVASNFELPASLAIVSARGEPVAPVYGSTIAVDIEIANVGAEPAEDVTLRVESALSISTDEVTLGSIGGNEITTVPIALTATEPGEQDVQFTVSGANAGETSDSKTLTIVTKRDLVETATGTVADLIDQFHGGSNFPGNSDRSFVAKLEQVQKSIGRALRLVAQNKRKQADNALTTAINQLGAFLNALYAAGETGHSQSRGQNESPSGSFVRTVEQAATVAIDQLSRARDAALDE